MTGISDAIRNLLASYHFYGDNHLTEAQAGLFAQDGILETVDSGTFRGREAVAGFLRSRHERRDAIDESLRRSRHHLATVYIAQATATSAEVHSYFQLLTPHGLDHWGTYDDSLIHDGNRWLFALRRVRVDGMSAHSWRAQ
jgi:SnoaL-like domain